jgi:hypothetical protein
MIVIPRSQEARDYAKCVGGVIDIFSADDLTPDDVVGLIVLPDSDIFRYRVETPESVWGRLRLGYTQQAMHALYDVLLYSAAGRMTQRRSYTNVGDQAKAFANNCQFGQTEYGSFVLKVFCPTNPSNQAWDTIFDEPFGRGASRAVVENFEFLASEDAGDPENPLPPTLNAQVASAVKRLKPETDFGSGSLAVRFSPLLPPERRSEEMTTPRMQEVLLDNFTYSRAQSIHDRLKKADEFERELLTGFVVNLHKDRPTITDDPKHEIALEIKHGGSWRKVVMRLTPPMYREAVKWHDAGLRLQLDAKIDKRGGRQWTVAELYEMQPMRGQTGQLFEESHGEADAD